MNKPDKSNLLILPERRANRPITRTHRAEFLVTKLLFAIFRVIGIDAASLLAGKFTRAIGPLIKPISRRAERNLKIAFPSWDDTKIKQTIAGVWENLGRTTAEFAHLDKFDPTSRKGRITIQNLETLQNAITTGKPLILVSGHFANWETLAIALHRVGGDAGIVYRPANNPLVDEFIINVRGKVMSKNQIPKGKRGARQLLDTLQEGRALAMLVDQKLNDGISVPFFGKNAMTAPTPARLALKFNAQIIPVSIKRMAGAHFHLFVHPPLVPEYTGNTEQDTYLLTKQINEKIEEFIIQQPDQWLWFHRRWPKEDYL